MRLPNPHNTVQAQLRTHGDLQYVLPLCSYDLSDNIFVQVLGRKWFILAEPSEFRKMQLHPSNHPSHHTAQTDMYSLSNTGNITALQTTLNPGIMRAAEIKHPPRLQEMYYFFPCMVLPPHCTGVLHVYWRLVYQLATHDQQFHS